MPPYGNDPEPSGRARGLILAGVVLLLAFSTAYLPATSQEQISATLQASALRPFISTQEFLSAAGARRVRVESLVALVDSLSSSQATHAAMEDENRTLRGLLGLRERAGLAYVPATVSRPGTPGSESMFLVNVGARDGVRQGSPVVSPSGLVGVIREVRRGNAVGMDWTHPEFRASGMLADGSAFGLVENRPGRFRREDRLVLNGIAYNEDITPGASVLTSGLGVLPRGIPIGQIDTVADEQGTWRKSYWLVPVAEPGAATHVLILIPEVGPDVSDIWLNEPADPDSSTSPPPTRDPR